MSIHEKLLKFHAEFNGVKKTGLNPHFKSKHFTLDEIVHVTTPMLNKLGLYVVHAVQMVGEVPCMVTLIKDSDGEGGIESAFPMAMNPNPQDMGSAVTYYKRYNLCALLNIAEEDDDGQKAADAAKRATDKQWAKINEYREADKIPPRWLSWLDNNSERLTEKKANDLLATLKDGVKDE